MTVSWINGAPNIQTGDQPTFDNWVNGAPALWHPSEVVPPPAVEDETLSYIMIY